MSPGSDLTVPVIPLAPGQLPAHIRRSSFYRHMLHRGFECLDQGKKPKILSSTGQEKIKLALPPGTQAKLEAFCEEHETTKSDAFFTLALLGLAKIEAENQKTAAKAEKYAASPKAAMPFDAWCPEQSSYWAAVQPALTDAKIVLAEGTTGIGKGRVLAAAAAQAGRKGQGPVWVTSSTVVLVGGLFSEFLALPKTLTSTLRATILPGKTEFISSINLIRYQEAFSTIEPEQAAAVDRWIAAGAPPVAESPLTRAIERMGLNAAWLANDLRQIAPSYPVTEVLLSRKSSSAGGSKDAGEELAAAIRQAALEDTDIIFATHAMLGMAHLTGWTIAPTPKFLIVDETHLLEQAIANIRSKKLSFFSLTSELKLLAADSPGSKVLRDAIKIMDDLKTMCARFDKPAYQRGNSGRPVDLSGVDQRHKRELAGQIAQLGKLLSSKTCATEPALDFYRDVLSAVTAATDEVAQTKRFAHALLLTFSPDRRFPSIQSGPRDVGGILGSIWKTAENGGIAASATIHTRSETGEIRADYLRSILAIPAARGAVPNPVIAPHIFNIPVLHQPGPGLLAQHNLIPPSIKATSKERQSWIDAVAAICWRVVSGARGGTMILCTSYTQVNAIAQSMVSFGIADDRVVRSDPKTAFAITEQTYRAKYRSGGRPIMIALGPAWTGITLVDDVPAADDFLLTDLVIPRMPVALNNTVSMQERIERAGMSPITQEALMTLKQGAGRLIRRPGVTHRHLWVLDGRIWQPELTSFPKLGRAAARMLKDYRKIEHIPPV